MNMMQELGAIAPIWVTAIAAGVVLLLTVASGYRRPAPEGGGHLAFVAIGGLAVSTWLLWNYQAPTHAFTDAIIVDGLGATFGIVATVGALLAVLISAAYLKEHGLAQGEYYALILLATVGMLVLIMAGDLIVLFLGIEIMSLAVYVLAGYRRSARRTQEAALKYFVYGAFASAFVIFGIAQLYGEVGRLTGTPDVSFAALARAFHGGSPVSSMGWIGVGLILAGLAFKIAAVPFHMWAPDVYEGAPTPSTGFMAVGIKAAAFAGLCRFVAATLLNRTGGTETSIQILEIMAISTMFLGNLLAVRQQQIKRMLAYSSIAHAGYALVGVAAFVAKPSSHALEAIAYYLLGYSAMTLGAFGVVLAFERHDDKRIDLSIDRLSGAAHRYPALGLAMSVFMFALAGVPPTAGFFGKLSLFTAAISAGRVGVVVAAVIASAIGAYYYLKVLVVMYMRATHTEERRTESAWLGAGLWMCAVITLFIGILPETYMGFARRVLTGWTG